MALILQTNVSRMMGWSKRGSRRSNLKTGSVPTIQPQRPKALPEARKRTMKSEEKEIPATASQTPGKRSRTSRAVHKLSVSRVSNKPM